MPYYTKLGEIPPTRHIQFRRPDGALYSEEVFGTEGFVGPTSTLYHIHPPTQVSGWKNLYSTKVEYVEQSVMRMRHLNTNPIQAEGDAVTGRKVILGNNDVEMSICQPAEQMLYHYKNGQGDDLLFFHYGSGTIHTQFGTLTFGKKDYVILPKGIIYKIVFDDLADADRPEGVTREQMPFGKFLCFETMNTSHYGPPPRYVSKANGQFLEHAPYCERDFRIPQMPLSYDEKGDYEVRIKARDSVHSYIYPYHPLDVVGWDGCYYPYCFNIDSFAPIVGKTHMPPPIHQTFEAHNFVICSFCPRLLDFHPLAIPVPYNHSNLDSDEVLYYVEGNYKARRGIVSGSISLHPQGIAHGPHPGTVEASLGKERTDELAVMCDTFRPLFPTKFALDIDDPHYPESWRSDHHAPGEVRAADNQDGTVNTWT
ncbi:MAG: homogentisate 1,2-dioxygenase [Phycisphaerales bacterium JB054]